MTTMTLGMELGMEPDETHLLQKRIASTLVRFERMPACLKLWVLTSSTGEKSWPQKLDFLTEHANWKAVSELKKKVLMKRFVLEIRGYRKVSGHTNLEPYLLAQSSHHWLSQVLKKRLAKRLTDGRTLHLFMWKINNTGWRNVEEIDKRHQNEQLGSKSLGEKLINLGIQGKKNQAATPAKPSKNAAIASYTIGLWNKDWLHRKLNTKTNEWMYLHTMHALLFWMCEWTCSVKNETHDNWARHP